MLGARSFEKDIHIKSIDMLTDSRSKILLTKVIRYEKGDNFSTYLFRRVYAIMQ